MSNPTLLTAKVTNAKTDIGSGEVSSRQSKLVQLHETHRCCVQYHAWGSFLDAPVDNTSRERLEEP